MQKRATPVIALRMSNNTGVYYFMDLHTGKHIYSYQWEELLIDEYVIEWVEYLTEDKNQPVMHDRYPNFDWASGVPIMDDIDEEFG